MAPKLADLIQEMDVKTTLKQVSKDLAEIVQDKQKEKESTTKLFKKIDLLEVLIISIDKVIEFEFFFE